MFYCDYLSNKIIPFIPAVPIQDAKSQMMTN
jgi:hypothetical protein